MTHRIQDALKRVRVMDGAMGTMLLARGLALGEPAEAWNVSRPDEVAAVHRAHRAAHASALVTNTFGAHPGLLVARGSPHRLPEVVRAAVRLARGEAGDAFVLGSVGPARRPGDEPRPDAWRPLIAELAAAGVDALLVETLRDAEDVEHALAAAEREAPGLPMIASAAFLAPQAPDPLSPEALAGAGRGRAAALGVNCTLLPEPMTRAICALAATGVPVCARPAAGLPGSELSPGEWARAAFALAGAGARWIGGCCGTTPAHIAALAALMAAPE